MIPLDERERRISLWAAAVAAGTWVALWALSGPSKVATVLALIGLALAGLLALAARNGSRVLTGIAAVVLGYGPWGQAFILGMPYIALAAWLLYRGMRAKRAQRATETATEVTKKPAPRAGRAAGSSSRPRANKRYTPPQRRSS